ncbi:MAG: hypothetical protein K9G64_08070, partial [Bacteroidia bacterium]|nr:hypothetical protein [Bacteroidia bacterium]
MSKINLEEYLRFEIYKHDEGKEITEWLAINEISKDELIDILEADELYFIIKDKINSIIKEKYAADFNFYLECMNRNIDNTPFHILLETMFENWSIEDQSRFIVELACQIRYNSVSLFDIPNFLIHEREILIAATYDFWDKDSKEQDFFKNCVREANYSKDWEFIEEVFESDDGSIASIIADESIQELPQYWHREFKAWYKYPKESNPEP